ncbi:unnamed protein product [marine sediment metagenome]|uniref:Aldehyde dehydrogenase domain-containing protein n=1 Tax=marine sediment metagenome TaxID=412755 RepID=X1KKP9_9ZZZZ
MFNGIFHIPAPLNEPCLQYAPGSRERAELKAKLKEMLGEQVDVPMIIDGEEVRSGQLADIRCPHDHHHILGRYHQADGLFVTKAVDAAEKAKGQWGEMPWDSRAIVFLKAAELLAGKYRQTLNAATMLNMSKTPNQAEIDSACELIDFWRFNPHFMEEVYGEVLQIVIDYPDCVRPVKVSTITEPTHDRYLSRPIISSSTTEISPAKTNLNLNQALFIDKDIDVV